MSTLRLYSPPLALLAWMALLQTAAAAVSLVTVCGLVMTAWSIDAHIVETRARQRDPWRVFRSALRRSPDKRGEQHPSNGRRSSDNRRTYRDLWLFVITALVLLALKGDHDTLGKVQHSRIAATRVTCGVLSAIADAGRGIIVQSEVGPETPFTRFLEQHGYPSPAARARLAQAAAAQYAELISARVAAAVGPRKAASIVRSSGSIDCTAFEQLVKLGPLN